MNKKINLIIGSGVLSAYLSSELIKKNEEVIVTSRSIKSKMRNFEYLKINKKIKFEKLNVEDKIKIEKIIDKYKPYKIFYFSGQSSLTKSLKNKKETFNSHYKGTENFINLIKRKKLKTKFFKANSGYIFQPYKGRVDINCKFSNNKNPYIVAQQKTFKLLKKYRKFGLNLFNLIFMQVESPLRSKDFFIKKVCLAAKNKNKIKVGNINNFRDYSWVTDIIKAIYLTSKLNSKDFFISAGTKLSGKQILESAYKFNKLDYMDYISTNKKFFRYNEDKILVGSTKNSLYLKKKFNFKFKIYGKKLINKMYKSL